MKKDIQFVAGEKGGIVSGLLLKSPEAKALLVLAHGAGAGMRHRFMEDVAVKLGDRAIATFRYQFPYMEKRIKRPDTEAVLTDTVRAAVIAAQKQAGDLPLFAGGKSMGGRMTSLAAAKSALEGVRGLIYFNSVAMGEAICGSGAHLAESRFPCCSYGVARWACRQVARAAMPEAWLE
jgi:predicted alpha/beta-hydrolase family hydrolase